MSVLSQQLSKEAQEDAIYTELLSQDAIDDAVLHEYMRRKNMRAKSRDFLHYTAHVAPWFVIEEIHILIAEAFDDLAFGETDRLMLFLPPRAGKALEVHTPIPTPDGYVEIGKLQVGDKVFSDTGAVCSVTAISPIWKNRDLYAVVPKDGDTILADGAHEWVARLDRKSKKYFRHDTASLARRATNPKARPPLIDANGALDLPEQKLLVHPYTLGAWLGNGRTDDGAICTPEKDVIRYINQIERGIYGLSYRNGAYHFRTGTSFREGEKRENTLKARLRTIGVLNNKHIPKEYLRASKAQRLELLRGLLDTDGYIDPRGGLIEFTSTLRILAEQTRELVNSLGVKASISEGRAMLNGLDYGPKWRVCFYMADAFHCERKNQHAKNGIKHPGRYIDVTYAGKGNTICIEVDSPSHMFLAGKTMLPTHNSELSSKLLPSWWEGLYPTDQVLHTSYAGTLVEKFGRQIRNLIMTDAYQEIFPETQIAKDSKAAGQWATSKGGIYNAAGVGAGIAGKGFNCLQENVRLFTHRGVKRASSLAVGDNLLSSTGWQQVNQIFLTHHAGYHTINGRLRVTAEHPIWVGGQWVPAGSLKPGMRLSTLTLWRKLWLRADSLVKRLKRKLGMQ